MTGGAETRSRPAIAIGVWMTALGAYSFVLFFSNVHGIGSRYPPIHLPMVFAVGLVVTPFDAWLD